jgi:hypothetical protein
MKNKTLIITIRSDDVDQNALMSIKDQLQIALPEHHVAIIGVGKDDSVDVHEFSSNLSANYREEA